MKRNRKAEQKKCHLHALWQSNRGASLAEALGAVVLTAIVLSGLLFLMNQMNSSAVSIQSREQILQQSRDLMNHMVQSARRGFDAHGDANYALRLEEAGEAGNDQYIRYRFDREAGTVAFESSLIPEGGSTPVHTAQTLATHVSDLQVLLAENNTKITIRVTLMLPNGETTEQSTVVYSL